MPTTAPPAPLQLSLQRIPFAASIDQKMRTLKSRTGITPNILARYGFALSLEEPGDPPNPFAYEEPGRDINRNTLLGQHDDLFIALLRTWVYHNGLLDNCDQQRFDELFVAHMNRGFELLSSRMRDLSGLQNLLAITNSK